MSRLRITQRRSRNGSDQRRFGRARSLGLRRIGHSGARRHAPDPRDRPRWHAWSRCRRTRMAELEDNKREERIGLHNLRPAPGSRRPRKRVGRGEGSGTGETSGRGQKGWGSRSGAERRAPRGRSEPDSHAESQAARPAREEVDAVRALPHAAPVNLLDLEARFDPAPRSRSRRCTPRGWPQGRPVKVLAKGEVTKPLNVFAHAFSAAASRRPADVWGIVEAKGGGLPR